MRQQVQTLPQLLDVAQLSARELSIGEAMPASANDLHSHEMSTSMGYRDPTIARDLSSASGSRVLLFDNGRCIASGAVVPAESGHFAPLTGLDAHSLEGSVGLMEIRVEPRRQQEILPVLLYLLTRRARIWGRHSVLTYVSPGLLTTGANIPRWERLANLPVVSEQGSTDPLWPVAQRLDLAIHHAYRASGPSGQAFLSRFFVPEAVETLELHIDRFFRTEFFEAVYGSTLTKQQYVYSMANLHQFVRYTTRLIGRAVSLSTDEDLRNHWLKHLSGEINHEKIIEKDLANLGADVDYVVNSMVPNVHNQEFMVMQESVIGFHQDPVLFMAAPFAAEGWTARLTEGFMSALDRTIRGWGIDNPRHVTGFLSSHIHYDGGDDGHWEGTRQILGRYIESDQMLQKFLNLVHLAMNAFERSYSSYVTEQRLWGAQPVKRRALAPEAEGSAFQGIASLG